MANSTAHLQTVQTNMYTVHLQCSKYFERDFFPEPRYGARHTDRVLRPCSGPAATIGVLVLQRRRRSRGCERCRNRFGVEGWCFTRAVAIDLDNLETPAAMAN
jgi:hypothetical protein